MQITTQKIVSAAGSAFLFAGLVTAAVAAWLLVRSHGELSAEPFSVKIISRDLEVLPVGDPPHEVVIEVLNRGPGPLAVVGFKQS